MESDSDWRYGAVINELVQGMENANQLKFHLRSTYPPNEARELLLQRIIHSYEKALMILHWNGSDRAQAQARVSEPQTLAAQHGSSSITVDGSPRSEDLNISFKDSEDYSTPKKRKLQQTTWTKQVRVNPENGLEGPTDDGFNWRKYGQKDILGAKYPRSYYRCTYRSLRNCWAMKQVQRSDEDPSVFDITYKGTHTCNTVQPQASSEEKDSSHNNSPQEHNQTTLTNLKSNLRVSTEHTDQNAHKPPQLQFSFPCQDGENPYFPIFSSLDKSYLGAYSEVFVSPEASESNYFSPSAYQVKGFEGLVANFEQHTENSDIAEIVSGHASTSNSPIGGMEFASESFELDPNFRFDAMRSFP